MIRCPFTVLRRNLIIVSLCLLSLGTFIKCQDYVYGTYNPIPIQPLSERGLAHFKKTELEVQVAQYGCNVSLNKQSVYTAVVSDNVTLGLQHGNCTAITNCGQNTVTVSVDVLGIINVIPVFFEAVCRVIDINGKYYRQNKKAYCEAILYEVDKKRCAIYVSNNDIYSAQQKDIEYLTAILDEFELSIRACNKRNCARHAAKREARESIQELLRGMQLQNTSVTEQYHTTDANFSKKGNAQDPRKLQNIQGTFTNNLPALENMMQDSVLYAEHISFIQPYVQQRAVALQEIKSGAVIYRTETYAISHASKTFLEQVSVSDIFMRCYV